MGKNRNDSIRKENFNVRKGFGNAFKATKNFTIKAADETKSFVGTAAKGTGKWFDDTFGKPMEETTTPGEILEDRGNLHRDFERAFDATKKFEEKKAKKDFEKGFDATKKFEEKAARDAKKDFEKGFDATKKFEEKAARDAKKDFEKKIGNRTEETTTPMAMEGYKHYDYEYVENDNTCHPMSSYISPSFLSAEKHRSPYDKYWMNYYNSK